MNFAKRTLIAAASLLAASTAEAAGTLTTAPAYDTVGLMACLVVNASAEVVRLTVETRDNEGGLLDSFGPLYLQPGQITGSGPLQVGGSYCAFQILEGKPKQLRAAANYRDASSNLMIVPAR